MGKQEKPPVLLAVSPTSRGIGYVVFEEATKPLNWGVKQAVLRKHERCERHVESLLAFHEASILVLEHIENQPSRKKARLLNRNLAKLAEIKGVTVRHYKKENVHGLFSQYGYVTKHGIARTIGEWLPELKIRVPRYRLPWNSENYSMAIFDATALALTHFYLND